MTQLKEKNVLTTAHSSATGEPMNVTTKPVLGKEYRLTLTYIGAKIKAKKPATCEVWGRR